MSEYFGLWLIAEDMKRAMGDSNADWYRCKLGKSYTGASCVKLPDPDFIIVVFAE
jgi:hypothetical protein